MSNISKCTVAAILDVHDLVCDNIIMCVICDEKDIKSGYSISLRHLLVLRYYFQQIKAFLH